MHFPLIVVPDSSAWLREYRLDRKQVFHLFYQRSYPYLSSPPPAPFRTRKPKRYRVKLSGISSTTRFSRYCQIVSIRPTVNG
jgi:hypothetical protein